jgi:hypothetical protein
MTVKDVKICGFANGDRVRHHRYATARGTVRHTGLIGTDVELAVVRWHGTPIEEELTPYLASLLVFA